MTQNLSAALDSLATTGKRERVHDSQMVLKVPAPVKKLVEEYAQGQNVSAATIVRFAVAEYFERRGVK